MKIFMSLILLVYPVLSYAQTEATTWNMLSFHGSKILVTLTTEITREKVPVEVAREELYTPKKHKAKQPTSDHILKTQITSTVLGNGSIYTVWQNPDLEALQRTTLYTGFKKWYRNYRFLPEAVYSQKIKPEPGEADKGWQKWSNIHKSIHNYKPAVAESADLYQSRPLSESAAIFNALEQGHIQKSGDKHVMHIFNKSGNFEVTLHAAEEKTLTAEFQKTVGENTSTVKNQIDSLKVLVNAKSLGSNKKSKEFKFMGFKESIVIYFDPAQRLPIRLTGKVDFAGNIEINLDKARFTDKLSYTP